MADWNAPLPPEAVEGAETHVEDHNALRAALQEVRSNVDGVEGTADAAAPDGHGHIITDVDGLQTALDGKQASGDYATSAQLAGKADASALADLVARVEALESPEA